MSTLYGILVALFLSFFMSTPEETNSSEVKKEKTETVYTESTNSCPEVQEV